MGNWKSVRALMLLRPNVTNRQAWVRSRWRAQFDYSFIDHCLSKSSIIRIELAYGFDKNHMSIFHCGPTNWHCWQNPMCRQSNTEKQSTKISTNEPQASLCERHKCQLPQQPHSEHQQWEVLIVTNPAVFWVMTHSKNEEGNNKTNK